jgi:hypothetical protein
MKTLFLLVAVGAVFIGAVAVASLSGHGSRGFCARHDCIPNFSNGSGYIVECVDGMWSHSGGLPGACSYHGGETGITAPG